MKKRRFFAGLLCLLGAAAALYGRAQTETGGETARELRFGLASELTTLDPLDSSTTADGRSILFNVYEGLVKPDTDGTLLPALAESYAIEEGGLVYRFVLRQGVKFHDGTTVLPGDVAFTLNTARDARYTGFSDIDRVELRGDREIAVILKKPDPEFLPYLTIGVVPEHNGDRKGSPVGTGPFKVASYTPQESLVLVKNPDYWRPGVPLLDKVTLVFVANSDALQVGLLGGNLDGATVTGPVLDQLDPGKFEIVPGYSNTVQLFALNNARPPLDDLRVRQAIAHVVDPAEIIALAFYGRGEPSGSPVIPGLKAVYEPSLTGAYAADPAKARALLAEAGYADGFDLEITVPSNYTMHVDTANVIVNQLARAGIRARITQVEWAAWLTDVYRGRQFDATIISFDGSSVPLSPRSFLNRYVSTTSSNFISFASPDYDAAYAAALSETDEARRVSFYKEAQRVISREAASVFIQDIMSFKVFKKGFKGALNYPLYVIDFSTIYRE